MMWRHCLVLALGLVLLHLSSTSAAEGGTLRGRVLVPNSYTAVNGEVRLYTPEGQMLKAYCDSDGSFMLYGVPKGTHALQVDVMGLYYPEVQVTTSAKGKFLRALLMPPPPAKQAVSLLEPLQLRPYGEMQYYEKRKPIDVWGFVKSPYGIMVVFGLFVVFVMPRLKVDPEEMQQMQAQLKGTEKAAARRMERIQE